MVDPSVLMSRLKFINTTCRVAHKALFPVASDPFPLTLPL
jgi:hypothetical protein